MLWGHVLPTTGVIHGAEQGSAAHRFICQQPQARCSDSGRGGQAE